MDSTTAITRREARSIFKRNRGAQAEAARKLGIAQTTMSKWLHGHVTTRRLDVEIPAFAAELLRREQSAKSDAA